MSSLFGSADAGWFHRRATEASLVVALGLVALKLFAYVESGSVAVLSTAFDSGLDAVASLVNLLAVRHAQMPADDEHRFGHGKAEPLAGLGQTLFIGISAALLLSESVSALRHPEPVDQVAIGISVALISIVATWALLRFQSYALRRGPSVAVAADSLHYGGDLYLNLGVVVSLAAGALLGLQAIDPLFGIAVSVYLAWNAGKIFLQSWHMLMDRELSDEDRARIQAICERHPEVLGVHNIKTRQSGPHAHIHLDVDLDGSMSLTQAHDVGRELQQALLVEFPGASIAIHQDPVHR